MNLLLFRLFAVCFLCREIIGGLIKYNFIEDLTHPFDENTVYWYKSESFKFTNVRAEVVPNIGWMATNSFSSGEHGGTHLDAPYHFNKDGWKVADIPLQNFIREGILINVQEKVKDNRNFLLSVEDVKEWESINGEIPKDSVILIKFGWSDRYPDKNLYLGPENNYNFPAISKEAAEYIVSKKPVGVGLDVASVDAGVSKTYDTHKIFALANLYNLENVALASTKLPAKGFDLIVLPMKITKGTGGPVRIVAMY